MFTDSFFSFFICGWQWCLGVFAVISMAESWMLFFFFFFCNAWRSWVLIYVVLYLKHFRLSESFEGYVMWMIRYSKSFKSILSRGTFFWPGNECSTMNVIKSLCFVFIYILHIFLNYLFIFILLLSIYCYVLYLL